MGQQPPAACSTWDEPSAPEHQVGADRVCPSLNNAGRLSGIPVSMHPHGPEIVAEARLEEGTRSGVEGLTL